MKPLLDHAEACALLELLVTPWYRVNINHLHNLLAVYAAAGIKFELNTSDPEACAEFSTSNYFQGEVTPALEAVKKVFTLPEHFEEVYTKAFIAGQDIEP